MFCLLFPLTFLIFNLFTGLNFPLNNNSNVFFLVTLRCLEVTFKSLNIRKIPKLTQIFLCYLFWTCNSFLLFIIQQLFRIINVTKNTETLHCMFILPLNSSRGRADWEHKHIVFLYPSQPAYPLLLVFPMTEPLHNPKKLKSSCTISCKNSILMTS